ncbi:hypothetical protein BS78_07G011300 [Paspalum vaginatum]|nr:hypothetical protein BS78_07G011300 [Paspalum vaginatum]
MDFHAFDGSFTDLVNSPSYPIENPESCTQPRYSFDLNLQHVTDSYTYAPIKQSSDSRSRSLRKGNGQSSFAGEEGDDLNGDDRNGNDDEEERVGGRRLAWTEQDNIRLLSAWLNNSIDPIDGNCKKGEVYWKQVAKERYLHLYTEYCFDMAAL